MLQILGLRQNPYNPKKKIESFYECGWRVNSIQEIFESDAWLAQIPECERNNMYFTVSNCHDAKGRQLKDQHCIPFDIDGIVFPEPDDEQKCFEHATQIVMVALSALGLNLNQVASTFSGNGVQFFVGIKSPILTVEYFDKYRVAYVLTTGMIDEALKKAGLTGESDTSVWSPARLMRLPLTLNIKPGKPTRMARVISNKMLMTDFTLETIADDRAEDTEYAKPSGIFAMPMDTKAVLDGCSFLKDCYDNQNKITEPAWYAMISVLRWLDGGDELCHTYSEKYSGYDSYEVDQKIAQAGRFGARTCQHISSLHKGCKSCPHFAAVKTPLQIIGPDFIRTSRTGYRRVTMNNGVPKQGAVDAEDVVKYFYKKGYFCKSGSGELYFYNGKIWTKRTDDVVGSEIRNIVRDYPKSHEVEEVRTAMRETHIKTVDELNESIDGKICFNNGVLDFKSVNFLPHSKDFLFRAMLPYDYDPKADAPRFEKFLEEVISEESYILFMKEFIGYCASGDKLTHHIAPILYGSGRNGKSILIEVIREVIGRDNCTAMGMKDLTTPQGRAMLDGKLLDISEEEDVDGLERTGDFKNLIAGGTMLCRNLYENAYSAVNRCKVIMTCNEFPELRDITKGMQDRLIMIPFQNYFGDNADKFLIDKLVKELPGIFNIVYSAYTKSKCNESLSIPSRAKKDLQDQVEERNEISAFCADFLEFNYDGFTSRKDIYNEYAIYCESERTRPFKAINFWSKIRTGKKVLDKKTNGNRMVNIKLIKREATIC